MVKAKDGMETPMTSGDGGKYNGMKRSKNE
jgi:hypothetical protein